jgi:hypothetical protein
MVRRRLRSIDLVACLLLSAPPCMSQEPASPSVALTKAHALLDAGNPAAAIATAADRVALSAGLARTR